MLIAVGIASMFAFQVFVNIGVATALLPNTGIPLPFLSQGLSSLISSMIAIGIILNIRLQPNKLTR
jgi:rod shape determining protein RodA